jgi:hypothetical protein
MHTKRNRTLGRPKCGWRDAIKIGFKEIIWKGLVLSLFATEYGAMMSTVMSPFWLSQQILYELLFSPIPAI